MKFKHLVLTTAAAAALAACSQDKVLEENTGNAIGFRAFTDKATKAVEMNTSKLTRFWVTAFYTDARGNYFHDVPFSKNTSNFTSSSPYNWPAPSLDFFAYYPEESQLRKSSFDWEHKLLKNFAPNPQINDQVDFISVYKRANQTAGSVELQFKHQLSQIDIKAKNNNPNYTYKVQGIRIASVLGAARSFNCQTYAWEPDGTKATYTVEYNGNDNIKTLNDTPQSLMTTGNAMLLPQTLTPWNPQQQPTNLNKGAFLSVKIQILMGTKKIFPEGPDEFQWASVPVTGNWEAGKKYVYILDFSKGAGKTEPQPDRPSKDILGGPITFTVDVNNWETNDLNLNMDGTSVPPVPSRTNN